MAQQQRNPSKTIFIGNIPYDVSEDDLKEVFTAVGPVKSVRLVNDRETGKPKGYGFCEFYDTITAESAMRNLSSHEINGRTLRVDFADDSSARSARESGPPRGGPPRNDAPPQPRPGSMGMQAAASAAGSLAAALGNYGAAPGDSDPLTQTLAGMSKAQLYEIMAQMKQLVTANRSQARQILVANPQLTKAMFQAQIMLGMVQNPLGAVQAHTAANPAPAAAQGGPPSGPGGQLRSMTPPGMHQGGPPPPGMPQGGPTPPMQMGGPMRAGYSSSPGPGPGQGQGQGGQPGMGGPPPFSGPMGMMPPHGMEPPRPGMMPPGMPPMGGFQGGPPGGMPPGSRPPMQMQGGPQGAPRMPPPHMQHGPPPQQQQQQQQGLPHMQQGPPQHQQGGPPHMPPHMQQQQQQQQGGLPQMHMPPNGQPMQIPQGAPPPGQGQGQGQGQPAQQLDQSQQALLEQVMKLTPEQVAALPEQHKQQVLELQNRLRQQGRF
eukprot:jgi/Tetstr1/463558/TSEL_008437.t1